MHVITTLRTYLGLTQIKLAQAAGLTQNDISEMSNLPPYGQVHKYQRLSGYLGVPVEALAKNDYRAIPESFFEKHPAPKYLPEPTKPDHLLGRRGEEFILAREQDRLRSSAPALARLVLPFFKMNGTSPGYDILSFDDDGKPFALEVKTSIHKMVNFRLTNWELETAREMTAAGERYDIAYITNWGKETQTVCDQTFSTFEATHNIRPCTFVCTPRPKPRPLSGLAYFRQLRGLRQEDVEEALGVPQSDLSLYENGQRSASITFYLRASEFLDATVDQLLAQYDTPPRPEELS